MEKLKKIPVILDTDIGSDIDDTWALAMLLNSPELDPKLVVSATGDTLGRAKIAAKVLEVAGRSDIPVGIGVPEPAYPYGQAAWVADYDLARYPGTIHQDGVKAMVDTIMKSAEPVTLIAIAPLPNIGAAFEREPRIAEKTRFVGMHGAVRKGYDGGGMADEYNVRNNIPAAKRTFTAPWREMVITPLDTCGSVRLTGEKYQKVANCKDKLTRCVVENYQLWLQHCDWLKEKVDAGRSSILFDTVAVYLAFANDLLKMEEIGIRVDDDGFTREDPAARKIWVATEWKDYEAFEDLLLERLNVR